MACARHESMTNHEALQAAPRTARDGVPQVPQLAIPGKSGDPEAKRQLSPEENAVRTVAEVCQK